MARRICILSRRKDSFDKYALLGPYISYNEAVQKAERLAAVNLENEYLVGSVDTVVYAKLFNNPSYKVVTEKLT